jgi:hypothetical protein
MAGRDTFNSFNFRLLSFRERAALNAYKGREVSFALAPERRTLSPPHAEV